VVLIKKWLSFDEQISLISKRGFLDVKKYRRYIENVGYYRLSGYCYPFREIGKDGKTRLHTFYSDSSFADVVAVYEFDRKLRAVLFSAIEKIEVAFRVKVAYTLGKISPIAHLRPELLDENCVKKGEYENFLKKYKTIVEKTQRKRSFVSHHDDKNDRELPIWAAVGLLTFGCVTRLYLFTPKEARKRLSNKYFGLRDDELGSWISSISEVRNVCAHHSRLWNHTVYSQPKFFKKTTSNKLLISRDAKKINKIYNTVLCMVYILDKLGERKSIQEIKTVLKSFPEVNHLSIHKDMGFHVDWDKHEIWDS
jgi:abortive infection bacteriophage resistance protein